MLSGYFYYITNFLQILYKQDFQGWGRKRTGRFALWCHEKFGGSLTLLEDGFIRSIGLGVDGSPSFSLVEDDVGIYYDATVPSRLENILNSYDFSADKKLMDDARRAMGLIVEHNVSKYNNASDEIPNQVWNDGVGVWNDGVGVWNDGIGVGNDGVGVENDAERVLVIAQTQGDASLKYGMLDDYSTDDMINAALSENPNATVYLKMHPDVLSGKKKSDIDIESAKEKCIIIKENVNPIALLKHFSKVYTKTSQMGFEALLVGCDCVCFGMAFYAGWGITTDKSQCQRRKAKRSVEEVFAAAYILYTRYYNPYTNKPSDIFDTIETIVRMRGF